MNNDILKNEEKAVFKLRSLYKQYGYLPYKMSKFEEYDLYVNNKDFLVSDRVITFNDSDGKLLALKPDVTMSVIKNGATSGEKKKVYYNENVYRISGSTKNFKEIMQAGLECIGDIGVYDIYEAVLLAVKSLDLIGNEYVLDVSHLGFISSVLDGKDVEFKKSVLKCVAEKNTDELSALCKEYGNSDIEETLLGIVSIYGEMGYVIESLKKYCITDSLKNAYNELNSVYILLKNSGYADKIRFDFSLTGDIRYYNGIVFKGYVNGITESVLSGGQYDKLAKRISNASGAVGFAVYLDLLENYNVQRADYDVDTVVLYDDKTEISSLIDTVNKIVNDGKSVSAQKSTAKLRYKNLVDMRGDE